MTDFKDEIGLEIPAYLRGELSPSDMARIEALAADNPEIAADIEFQRHIISAVKEQGDNSSVGEFGWARLSKAMSETAGIDLEASQTLPAQTSNDNPAKPLKFWRIAAAALAVLSLGQASVIASKSLSPDDDARYVMVSETPQTIIDVVFQDSATHKQVTELLQAVKGELVSGPNRLGLYKVQLESKKSCSHALQTFNAANEVINTSSNCE